jgi:hypothetical protein
LRHALVYIKAILLVDPFVQSNPVEHPRNEDPPWDDPERQKLLLSLSRVRVSTGRGHD